jgi:hypothetical protein
MSEAGHKIYISILVSIVVFSLVYLTYTGIGYYRTAMEERFYHAHHQTLKPSGVLGHGYGIIGSLLIIIGVGSYMARKRYKSLARLGKLKHWLEFHIFLCTLGPVLILFHTSFKFGGIVAISFWSMVAVFLSGIIGRFIYIQIPRTIEGRELSLNEVRGMRSDLGNILKQEYNLDDASYQSIVETTKKTAEDNQEGLFGRMIKGYFEDLKTKKKINAILKQNNLRGKERKNVMQLISNEISLNRKIGRLQTMQNLFKYWHVAHLPFALVMLIIMVIHVVVTIVFGYRWIF